MGAFRNFNRAINSLVAYRQKITLAAVLIFGFGGIASAAIYRLIINPTTGNLDEVLNIIPGSISAGQCLVYDGTKFIGAACGSTTTVTTDLLLEDGNYLLLEDGSKLGLN